MLNYFLIMIISYLIWDSYRNHNHFIVIGLALVNIAMIYLLSIELNNFLQLYSESILSNEELMFIFICPIAVLCMFTIFNRIAIYHIKRINKSAAISMFYILALQLLLVLAILFASPFKFVLYIIIVLSIRYYSKRVNGEV